MSTTITNKSAFTKKSLGKQVALTIVTFGLYQMYWFYDTADQFDKGTDKSISAILMFIPPINILPLWNMCEAAETVTEQSQIVLFLVFVFFPPLSWYWIQGGINEIASN
jgi:hypothetical protein